MNDKEKLSFSKRVIISITNFEKYQEFAFEPIGKAIKYLFKLILLFVIVISIAYTFKFKKVIDNAFLYLKNNISDVKFENNKLEVNSNNFLILENPDKLLGILIIDTNELEQEKYNSYYDKLGEYDNGIVLLKDKLIAKNPSNNMRNVIKYEDLTKKYSIEKFDKNDLLNYINGNLYLIYTIIFVIIVVYLFVLYILSTLIDSLVLAILGYFASKIAKIKIKFSGIYNMSIYALTLPILLNMIYTIVNLFTGFKVKYFEFMYTTISYIYIITAILMIKSDLIKKQMELRKIINENIELDKEKENLKPDEEKKDDDKKDSKDKKKKDNLKKEIPGET